MNYKTYANTTKEEDLTIYIVVLEEEITSRNTAYRKIVLQKTFESKEKVLGHIQSCLKDTQEVSKILKINYATDEISKCEVYFSGKLKLMEKSSEKTESQNEPPFT